MKICFLFGALHLILAHLRQAVAIAPDLRFLSEVGWMAFLAGMLALVIRTELILPGKTIIDQDTYNQIFTLHGAIMIFLVIIPSVPASLGNFVLPMMLGAKDVAFPRMNLASFHLYLIGATLAVLSIIIGAIDRAIFFTLDCRGRRRGRIGRLWARSTQASRASWIRPMIGMPNATTVNCAAFSSKADHPMIAARIVTTFKMIGAAAG